MAEESLLEIRGLELRAGEEVLVDGVDLDLPRGGSLGLLGQSGSGKTLTALAVLGLLPPGVRRVAGTIRFDGVELSALDEAGLRPFRGGRIALVFQEAMSAFNPVLKLGRQVAEVLELHRRQIDRRGRPPEVLRLFEEVGLKEPERVARSYPHELSGGMLQRCLIAMALAGEPELLIADEPTTALDVTVQARILELVAEIRRRRGLSLLWISHDLGVVARVCGRVAVMRGGRVLEQGEVEQVLRQPAHPYTRELMAAAPRLERSG
ncbi:MAG: ABC transporter ATP-binding protein [Planctomycetes bacterium]|nr:ABC transporter ATP-binding protein [Planctomycetota bacterium]MBL7009303.1 ABC transporter ATP-binding protein [Planctomycetota bacterium]